MFFLQFVLIGAGKPAEYGRFGIFTNTALAIGTACLLAHRWMRLREIINWVPAAFVVTWVGFFGGYYLWNFHVDCTEDNSRLRLARDIADGTETLIGVPAEPAPYCCPPLDFSRRKLVLADLLRLAGLMDQKRTFITATERRDAIPPYLYAVPHELQRPKSSRWRLRVDTPISWANKPFDRISYGAPRPLPGCRRGVPAPD